VIGGLIIALFYFSRRTRKKETPGSDKLAKL
jgi:hypothetical protein